MNTPKDSIPELAQRPLYSPHTSKPTMEKRMKKAPPTQVEGIPADPFARPEKSVSIDDTEKRLKNRKKTIALLKREGFTQIHINAYSTMAFPGSCPILQGSAILDNLPVTITVSVYDIWIGGIRILPGTLEDTPLASKVRYKRKEAKAIALNKVLFDEHLEAKTLEWAASHVKAGNYHVYKADGSKSDFGGNNFQGEEAVFIGNMETDGLKMDVYQVKAPVGWLGGSVTRFSNFPEAILYGYWKPENYGYGSGGVSTYRVFPRGTVVGIISASSPTPHYAGVVKFALIGTDLNETQERVASLMQRAHKMWEPHQ